MVIFWFRRDLRLIDNIALYSALNENNDVQPIFIFDENILNKLENKFDARVNFIYNQLVEINKYLIKEGGRLLVLSGKPIEVFKDLLRKNRIEKVYVNDDYEPYAVKRDAEIEKFLKSENVEFIVKKDAVIFHKNDILKSDNTPYTVFTPYSKKWKLALDTCNLKEYPSQNLFKNIVKTKPIEIEKLEIYGFSQKKYLYPDKEINIEIIRNYNKTRDYPAIAGTSKLSLHLRFGTISIRNLVSIANENSEVYLNELIWREFYMMIIWHYPETIDKEFKSRYRFIKWRNNEHEFKAWCEGKTGYPIVDAGMRELNQTGFMHNRLRMITASFLTKHLLIDWRWGESYFAKKLLDYEQASNVGGWQWAASTGCDAVPYFRIFNPDSQTKKFDPNFEYINKWLPEFKESKDYCKPIVDYNFGRQRALSAFKDI